MRAQCVMRERVSSCFGVAGAAAAEEEEPFAVPLARPFWGALGLRLAEVEVEVAAETGRPSSRAAARRTSEGEEEMRSRGQKEGVARARRACRAQVRQRFEEGGAEGEGASHLGLNWMRVDFVAGGVSFYPYLRFFEDCGGGEGGIRGDISVISNACGSSAR